jgi:hypothetical protein
MNAKTCKKLRRAARLNAKTMETMYGVRKTPRFYPDGKVVDSLTFVLNPTCYKGLYKLLKKAHKRFPETV